MLLQSPRIADSKGVQYNREVGRPNPVQQEQVRIPHIVKLHHLLQHATTHSFAAWSDNHFPDLEHSHVSGLKSFAQYNITLFSSLRQDRRKEGRRPGPSLPHQRHFRTKELGAAFPAGLMAFSRPVELA
jgi:hypothetical protein